MKTRAGFVSNSSSSSFIVVGDSSIIPSGINSVELTTEQKIAMAKDGVIKDIDTLKTKCYLTEFMSDAGDMYYELKYSDGDSDDPNKEKPQVIEYADGGHGGPYSEEWYTELDDEVWIKKEHNGEDV